MARAVLLLVVHATLLPWSAAAQTATSGVVTGRVTNPAGIGVPQALLSITPVTGGGGYQATASTSGAFRVAQVRPGRYEIRAEALGYRPVVARGLTIRAGEERTVNLTLNVAPPPVLTVDTVVLSASASSRWRAGGVQLGADEIDGLPNRVGGLASIAGLSTAFDDALGAEGLPGGTSLTVADGVAVHRAPHPTANAAYAPDALFPQSALGAVTPIHNPADIELSGAVGGYLGVNTRSSGSGGGVEFEGAYSGKPTWSSSELDLDVPSLLTYQGTLRGTTSLDERSNLLVSGDVLQHETPLAPRASDAVATSLAGLDPALLASLTDAGVERYARYSGLARLDVQRSTTSQLFLRGAGAFSKRDFDGAGPLSLAGMSAPAEESIDFSVAGGLISETSRNVEAELRVGVSGSYRDFGASISDVPPAYLVGPAASLGDVASAKGESGRTDFILTPILRYSPGSATLKFGAAIRASRHTMAHSSTELGDFLYSDESAIVAGRGFGQTTSTPEVSFGTQEYGLFAQYESSLASGIELRFGGRYDYELIGRDGANLNTDWFTVSGLYNDAYDDSFHQLGASGSLSWDPDASGNTSLFITGSLREGDVDTRVLYQYFSQATDATSTRFAGTGLDWPGGGIPTMAAPSLPVITLLGPDTRAPRSTRLSAGLTQRVAQSATIFARGSLRRTDFIARRRNLNLPLVAQAADPNGRSILGTLAQDGSLVTTTTDDARRFASFGEAWALDPDGWSEYLGITGGLEYSNAQLDLYGAYTYSETTDNWVGAATGAHDAMLQPGLPDPSGDSNWSEGVSDFDAPHRAAASATTRFGVASVSTIYRFRSGRPFTPAYRAGVDANGDGSMRNDVAYVPDVGQLGALVDDWPCLDDQADSFASRNSCRAPDVHTLDARLEVTLGQVGGRSARLVVDAFNLIEPKDGVVETALLLVDPSGAIATSPDGSTVTIPTIVNPNFGRVTYPSSRGRMLRVGVRIGG